MKRVLLVEDDDAIAEVVEVILGESGYAVVRVCTVADALVAAHSQLPAAVLLDLTLPETSGIAFLRACRESATLAGLPIALLSGRPLPALDDGLAPDAIVTKPFDIDHLCTVIDGLTRGARSTMANGIPQIWSVTE